jgi:subtilase family serine protease
MTDMKVIVSLAMLAQSQQRLRLAIHLPLRDQAALTQLLHDLYDPQSAQFHKYLSVTEFINRFAPS